MDSEREANDIGSFDYDKMMSETPSQIPQTEYSTNADASAHNNFDHVPSLSDYDRVMSANRIASFTNPKYTTPPTDYSTKSKDYDSFLRFGEPDDISAKQRSRDIIRSYNEAEDSKMHEPPPNLFDFKRPTASIPDGPAIDPSERLPIDSPSNQNHDRLPSSSPLHQMNVA
jgi:hypothetical protein